MQQIARSGLNATASLLKIGSLNLLLPQGEVRTLELSADIDLSAPALYSAGWVTYIHKRWPVYCLSEALSLMDAVPAERRACAMLATVGGYMGIMCDDLIVLKNFTAQYYELPAAMRLPTTPILYLAGYEQGIASVSNASRLTAYVGQLLEKEI